MEIIIQIIIEVFGELFIHLIAYIISNLFEKVAINFDNNHQLKNTVKISLYYVFISLLITLFGLSLFYQKTTLAVTALVYMLLQMILKLIKFINREKPDHSKTHRTIRIIRRILNYSYPVLLIILGSLWIKNVTALVSLIIISILVIIIFLCIDIYKIRKRRLLNKKNDK